MLALLLLLPAPAAQAAPILFDFEDGLQGWYTSGSVTRVNTGLLGGAWAIFGDGSVGTPGRSSLSREMDLTGIASIQVDQYFAAPAPSSFFVSLSLQPLDGGTPLAFAELPPFVSPRTRSFDLTGVDYDFDRLFDVVLRWQSFGEAPATAGFVDDVRFVPIPEPGTLGLVALGAGALARGARRHGRARGD